MLNEYTDLTLCGVLGSGEVTGAADPLAQVTR